MTTSVSYDFSGAVVLVTGGGSGIGAATARACAAAGATAIAVDVDPARLAEVAASGVLARQVDVADAQAVHALVAEVVRDYGRVDAAVLAAAIQMRTPVDAISDAEWRRLMAVNLDGVFHCIREVAPIMKRQRKGAILTFTSGLVNMGWPGASAYAASKGALVGLTKCVAHELRPFGVRANVLSPGLVATPVFLDVATEDEVAMYRNSVGISEPDAVVPTVLHLISDASASLTGAVIERRLVPAG
ncbi:MAG TPA: SDR family oxidoreductase [Burkholderiales bacterium]|nr:SDR family oxidoreductase [Burkholderiales bacterium]